MADIVENVLRVTAEKESQYKTTEVHKDIELEFDEGNLLVIDTNPTELKDFRSSKEEFLRSLCRDNTQLLINKLWELPTQRVQDVIVGELPPTKTLLPREKHVPQPKPPTKWEQYAKLKGIKNKKKSRMVWDEESQSYKPRWGYKRAKDNTKDWLIEVPSNADPYENQFEKRQKAKGERVAKNELQRLRNIARSQKSKVPGVGLTPTENLSKDELGKAMVWAKKSTASIGRFTENLPKEKPSRFTGKKRQFLPNHGDIKMETNRQLDILKNLGQDRSIIDKTRAANLEMAQEDVQRSKRKLEDPDFGKKTYGGKRSNQGKKGNIKKNRGFQEGKKFRGGGGGGNQGGAKFRGGGKRGGHRGGKR